MHSHVEDYDVPTAVDSAASDVLLDLQESDDEMDWEEVPVSGAQTPHEIEITVKVKPSQRVGSSKDNQKKARDEHLVRINCHKIHALSLLANARVRNKWLNDPLLKARLMSITPIDLQDAFISITKSRVPHQVMRGRLFETAITNLAEWWANEWFHVEPYGHIRNRTFEDVRASIVKIGYTSADSTFDTEALQDILDDDGETVRSSKSLMKHVLWREGSRDVSSQLFTSLCRALDIPARLIVSLQSMPWKSNVGKSTPKRVNKGKSPVTSSPAPSKDDFGTFPGDGQRLDDQPMPKSEKAKGKEKAKPPVKLRKQKSKGYRLGSPSRESSPGDTPADLTAPPVFWTEVFSRADARWLPVDPIRCIVNKRKVFDPSPVNPASTSSSSSAIFAARNGPDKRRPAAKENKMLYVVAFEEDGYARDVTRRYARNYTTKIVKAQGGSSTTQGGRQRWWNQVLNLVTRPYRLQRDDLEDEELESAQMTEGMPTTLAGFKDHPFYVLARHLKKSEVIYPEPPDTKELGQFRGEPVYPRSAVVTLKTPETWLRNEGRTIKEGCQPLKFVKMRPGTINRAREVQFLKDELESAGAGQDEAMQGLYARFQTELYMPDPVVNGKIPKNDFGNIDLYVPSMLPSGAVHLPYKGITKIAKKLDIDYAEAVTRFEFKKRRAIPVIEGVVVASENEQLLIEAYQEAKEDAEELERIKKKERVLKNWKHLVQGLRIRQRLREQYGTEQQQVATPTVNSVNDDDEASSHHGQGGGFLVDADDVVESFQLPKQIRVVDDTKAANETPASVVESVTPVVFGTIDEDSDSDMEEVEIPGPSTTAEPRTIQDLMTLRSISQIESTNDTKNAADATTKENDVSEALTSTSTTPSMNLRICIRPPSQPDSSSPSESAPRSANRKRRRKSSVDEGQDTPTPSTNSKRKRATVTAKSIPASTRTLRPRVAKSEALVRQEKEAEAAYRRAIAQ
ncbi:Rad4-domain-containing protein [Fistulina hepatica ATCC 64428]|uniref:Rad4-domain-containing protein n=1 Tax=Fistulina hepatica ATCC 64428 TaxID=1128425 RepID=A0A0D7AL97_9AGAR|nr:Rad4-domain-containing protein [Fistulina hepatica ATCC 64428]